MLGYADFTRSLRTTLLPPWRITTTSPLILVIASGLLFAIESKLNTFLFSTPFILVYLVMFMKKSVQDIEGAEEPERFLKNPYFAFYTLFLAAVFVLAYIFK